MCSVDPEGKWRWYLKIEYAVLTIAHYLKLGTSLGGVQTRHSLTPSRLWWRQMKRRWSAPRIRCRHEHRKASVRAFEQVLRDRIEAEEEGHDGATARTAQGSLDRSWEDMREEEDTAAAGTTWDSAVLLTRWEKAQLLKYYLALRDCKRGAKRRQPLSHRGTREGKPEGEDSTASTAGGPPTPPRSPPLPPIRAITPAELERELLTQLLNEFGDHVDITHAEAVDMRLLKLFASQAAALRAHRAAATRDGEKKHRSAPPSDEANDDNVFLLSGTDATYAACQQAGRPTAVTYAQAVQLATLLAEAIAWESFLLHTSSAARREALAAALDVSTPEGSSVGNTEGLPTSRVQRRQHRRAAAAAAAASAAPASALLKVGGIETAVQPDCVAIMLPNSVEYNLIWWGIARSGPLKTFLVDLYEGPAFTGGVSEDSAQKRKQSVAARITQRVVQAWLSHRGAAATAARSNSDPRTVVYRPCRTALINTNLSSNAMLYHALSCSGCLAIILDAQFVPLLFVPAADDSGGATAQNGGGDSPTVRLHVPPQLQRILLWRWDGAFTGGFTPEMKTLLDQFNGAVTECLPEALSRRVARNAPPAARARRGPDEKPDTASRSPRTSSPPPLDLFDLVKDAYEPLHAEAAAVAAPRRFQLLLSRLLHRPPRWLGCDPTHWTPRGTSAPPSPAPLSGSTTGARDTAPGPQQQHRATVTHSLFAQLYVRSLRDSMAKTRELFAAAAPSRPRHPSPDENGATGSATRRGPSPSPSSPLRTQQLTDDDAVSSRARVDARVSALDKQLARQQEIFHRRMAAALSRFSPVQPVLFIYTSGTTGLPKAARFSHLRFFATGFLSQTLRYRGKTREVLEADRAARERFQAALSAAAAGARTEAGRASTASAPLLPTAFVDEKTRIQKTNLTVLIRTCQQYVVGLLTLCLWALGLLFRARRLAFVLDRAFHTLTFRRAAWRRKYAQDAAIVEEVSRVSVYNCLPMYHTVGCVFCLGQLMHALEEQQAAQAETARQLAWHRVAPCRDPTAAAWATAPYASSRLPTARMVIRTKFSASRFLSDLQYYHITVVQYIGEVLRYAVLHERNHAPSVTEAESLLRQQLAAALAGRPARASRLPVSATGRVKEADAGDAAAVMGTPESASRNGHGGDTALAEVACRVLPRLADEADILHVVNLFGRWRVPYAFGNGLRKDIWFEVKERLSIDQPVEFYSSTEGNIFLFNLFDIPGAVGHIPRLPGPLNWFLDMNYFPIFPFRVVKYDEDTQQIWRHPRTQYGRIVQVDEPGEAVGEIIEGYDMFALRRFDGYHQEQPADTASLLTAKSSGVSAAGGAAVSLAAVSVGDMESKRKIVRHVMWPYRRDAYFRSGDLVKFDDFGFVSFVDRAGETFRWKGENVSTLEVANALSTVHTASVGVQEAVVYGVTLPGREGRAGMALLTLHRRFLHPSGGAAAEKEKVGRVTDGRSGGGAGPRQPSLWEERLFLQNDLFAFLCGRRRRNGDGTPAQSALPPYATPLFLRVEDAAAENEHDVGGEAGGGHDAHDSSTTAEDAVRTTTFKYRKAILARQGYSQVPPSTIADAAAWGEAEGGDDGGEPAVGPPSRFYVLVTKPDVWLQLARGPRQDAEMHAGYVPLTAATVKLVGERFSGCGW